VNSVNAVSSIGFRPKASEKEAYIGWNAAEHNVNAVPHQNASVLVALSCWEIVCNVI